MKGELLFKLFNPFFQTVTFFLKFFPKPIRQFFWSLIAPFPTKIGVGLRYCLVSSLAKKAGKNIFIGVNVEIQGWENLEIGSNVSIHRECYITANGGLIIGDNVSIAHQTSILTLNHSWSNLSVPIKYNPMIPKMVTLRDDVWIGSGVRIMPGVEIKSRTIVAAGAIVTKKFGPKVIIGGNPAKVLKEI